MTTTIGISLYKKPYHYVKECIESCLDQIVPVEVILRTDGPNSCDEQTLEYLKKISREQNNFTLIEGEVNLGIYGSYKEIFKNVKTDNICQLDADDFLHPEAIDICERVLFEHPEYSMVYTDCIEIDSEGEEIGLCERQKVPFTPDNLRYFFMTYHLRLIRTSVYRGVGEYDETLRYGGDYDLCLRISEIGEEQNIGYVPIPLYFYRRDKNCHSLTSGIENSNQDVYRSLRKSVSRLKQDDYLKVLSNKNYTEMTFYEKISDDKFKEINFEKSQPIVLTGMHRSFTSLTSNILTRLGIYMGESVLSPDVFNPEGYFENVDFLNFDRTLCRFSTKLEDSFIDWGWANDERMDPNKIEEFVDCAKKLIYDRRHLRVWGWKDPRTSLLLDFWDKIIPHAKYIFVYRHPSEVCESVSKLKGIEVFQKHPEYIEKCWREHNQNIYDFAIKNRNRCIVLNSNDLTKNPNKIKNLLIDKFELKIYDEENLEELVIDRHIRSTRNNFKLSRETLDLYLNLQTLNEMV